MKSSSSPSRIRMDEDRISSLPDCIIHEIFKFMDMKQVVATSLLSTRWTSIWQSNPYLNFICDDDAWEEYLSEEDEENYKRFYNIVDRVLLSRDHSSDVKTLCIKLDPEPDSPQDVDEWVGYAIRRHVQQVTLKSVQMNLLTVETLCENVKGLILDNVFIMLKEETTELLLNCPIMETLVLHLCRFYYNQPYHAIANSFRNIRLSAPNLKVLKFGEDISNNYTIENLSSLVTAEIDAIIWFKRQEDRADLVDNILRGLTNAQSLVFSLNNLPACSKVPITLNTVATFQNLRYLKLTTRWNMYQSLLCFSTILKLLQKSPNVETLVLDDYLLWEPEIMEEDLVAELQSWCRLCHLKTLEIESRHIAINDYAFKFIKCIIGNATSLKNVIMTTTDTSEEHKKLVNICEKLKVKPKVTKVSSQRIGVSLKLSTKIQ